MQTFTPLCVLISVLSYRYCKVRICNYFILAIPTSLLHDQFSFQLTASTTCALNYLVHHATDMLQRCDYVRCLMVDFTKAFDVVNHPVLLAKLARLDLPERAVNWIISYLTVKVWSYL